MWWYKVISFQKIKNYYIFLGVLIKVSVKEYLFLYGLIIVENPVYFYTAQSMCIFKQQQIVDKTL